MRIGNRDITADSPAPPYIIAELGVNHDGSVDRALELVKAAANAKADAIKLQLFETDRLLSKAAKLAAYQKDAGATDPFAMLRSLELSIEQMRPIVAAAHRLGLHAIVTVFSVELVEVAERLPWDAYKTASPDIINKPLLEALVRTGKPLIISTGASTLAEVATAISWIKAAHDRTAILQCVSSYPTRPEHAAIGGLRDLAKVWRGPLGYSDHTEDTSCAWIAVSAGAKLLEKHLTWRCRATGPDHAASLEPEQFAKYVEATRWVGTLGFEQFKAKDGWVLEEDESFGAPVKQVLPCERDVRNVSRQSLVTLRRLPAGSSLLQSDLTIKRPGTGLPPFELDRVIGRRLARNVEADMPLMPEDLA